MFVRSRHRAPGEGHKRGVLLWLCGLAMAVVLVTVPPVGAQQLPGIGGDDDAGSTEPEPDPEPDPEEPTDPEEPEPTTTVAPTTSAPVVTQAPASQRPTQVPVTQAPTTLPSTTTSETTTTTIERALLVPGDGTEGSESTTTTTSTAVRASDVASTSDAARIWTLVAGLLIVAAMVIALTTYYWRVTSPVGSGPGVLVGVRQWWTRRTTGRDTELAPEHDDERGRTGAVDEVTAVAPMTATATRATEPARPTAAGRSSQRGEPATRNKPAQPPAQPKLAPELNRDRVEPAPAVRPVVVRNTGRDSRRR